MLLRQKQRDTREGVTSCTCTRVNLIAIRHLKGAHKCTRVLCPSLLCLMHLCVGFTVLTRQKKKKKEKTRVRGTLTILARVLPCVRAWVRDGTCVNLSTYSPVTCKQYKGVYAWTYLWLEFLLVMLIVAMWRHKIESNSQKVSFLLSIQHMLSLRWQNNLRSKIHLFLSPNCVWLSPPPPPPPPPTQWTHLTALISSVAVWSTRRYVFNQWTYSLMLCIHTPVSKTCGTQASTCAKLRLILFFRCITL